MKPNILGGQTFESTPEELGVLRNMLVQADSLVNLIPEDTAARGDSPMYTQLWRKIVGIEGFFTNIALRHTIVGLKERVFEPLGEDMAGFESSVGETEVIIGGLRWFTDPETTFLTNTVSAEQKNAARRMLNQFDGVTPEN